MTTDAARDDTPDGRFKCVYAQADRSLISDLRDKLEKKQIPFEYKQPSGLASNLNWILLILVAFAYLPSIIYGYLLGSGLTVVLALDTWRVQRELLRAQAFQALSASGSLLSLRNPLTYVIDKSRL